MQRYAKDDTRLTREALDENIQVSKTGRFYPDEYSTAINLYQQGAQAAAEIPKSLAGIIEHHNDFKINTWANDQEEQIQAEKQAIAIDNSQKEFELTIATKNRVYERNLEYKDKIDQAIIEAEQNKESIMEAVSGVAADFKHQEDFASIPMANHFWADTFNTTTQTQLEAARTADRKREVYWAKYNMQDAIARRLPDIMQGRANAVNVTNEVLGEVAPYLSTLPFEDKKKTIDTIFSLATQERGRYIVDRVARGELKAEDGMNMLRGLLDETVSAEFEIQGTSDKEGNPLKFRATLIPEVQEYLFQTLKDAKNGGGSTAADGFLIEQKDAFDRKLGKAEIDNTGFTTQIFQFKNIGELDSWVGNQVAQVYNSNASDKTKIDTLTHMAKTYNQARTTMAVGALAKRSQGYTKQLLTDWVNKLEQDLKRSDIDWANYKLSVSINGNDFDLIRPGIFADNPVLGNAADATYDYYAQALPVLQKMKQKIENGSMHDLLPILDNQYFEEVQAIGGLLNKNSLLIGDAANGYSPNAQTIDEIATHIQQANKIAGFYGAQNQPMSTETVQAFVSAIRNKENGFSTGYETVVGSKAIATAFQKAGKVLDLAEYARTHAGQDGGLLMTSIVCATAGDTPIVQRVEEMLKLKETDPKKIEELKARNEAKSMTKKKGVAEHLNKVLEDNHIPKAHAAWWGHLSDTVLLVTADEDGNTDVYERNLKQLLDTQYINLGRGHKVQSAFFRHSPQMQPYAGADGEQRLSADLKEYNRQLENVAKRLNIPTERIASWTWYSDDTNKCIRLTEKAQGFLVQNGQGQQAFAGTLLNNDKIKNVSPRIRATFFAAGFGAHLLATDQTTRNKAKDESLVLYPTQYPEGAANTDSNIVKVRELYANPEADIKKDALMIQRTLSDPETFANLCEKTEKQGKRGALQVYATKNPTLNFLFAPKFNAAHNPTEADVLTKEIRSEGVTGFAAPIDYSSLIQAEDTHVGKIKQSDVSLPISVAAVGDEAYIDIYNVSTAGGYEVDDVYVPGVTMTVEYDGPTGMAAPVMTRHSAPKATGLKVTAEEIDGIINEAADIWGVDRKLARALIRQESGGQQYVVSKAGAIGLGQLMPETAKSLGVTDPTDAAQNIWGAMKYMNSMLKQFGGDVPLALAAYNAGPGAVAKAKGIPNIAETRNYVKSICGVLGIDPNNKSYPVTYPINNTSVKFIDSDTGMLSRKGLNDFTYLLNNSETYKGKVLNVVTNREELLEDKPEYADYKPFREMKNSEGKPLFVKGEFDGFKVNVKREGDGTINPASIPALADAAAASQTNAIPPLDRDDIEALLTTFSSKYNTDIFSSNGSFGLASLTGEEYESYGVPASVLKNPVMQARVTTQEFQRAKDILGSERKAVFALAGGDLRDNQGNIKSWAEVKRDKENFTKSWYIQPSTDAKRRDEINTLVASYEAERKRIRGF